MKKILVAAALLSVATLSSAQTWRFFPALKDGQFKFAPTVALTGNAVNPDDGPSARAYGLELNFNCGLIQSPDNAIRTYAQISRSSKNGVKATAFELSPRYTLPLGNGLSVGAGPALSVVKLSGDVDGRTLYGVGAAAGVDFRIGDYYAGADLRMNDTFKRSGVDYDHVALGLKVGINF